MKNPNGFGTVTKLSGKRRKPWVVKVTIGFDENTGKQIQKSLGTFATRPEALRHLSLHHVSEENISLAMALSPDKVLDMKKKKTKKHTFGECVSAVTERDAPKRSASWLTLRDNISRLLDELMDKNIDEIELEDMQKVINKVRDSGKSQTTLNRCKIMCSSAFEYAVIHKWIDRNDDYTKYIEANSIAERKIIHKPFTKEHIELLKNDDSMFSKVLLFYILTGCRANEPFKAKIYDDYIVCGSKTSSGKNRKIPIHSYLKPFISEVFEYLSKESYSTLNYKLAKFNKKYKLDYTMHDTRNTFATLGKEFDMRPTVIKKIMGHRINDLTDDVYTHESIEYLKKEIGKIKI